MRWLKMSRYLAEDTDWTPIIFKPKGANYLIKDQSLVEQVSDIETIECPIWEPNNILLKLGFTSVLKQVASGGIGSGDQQQSLLKKFMIWVRSNIFIPDARAFWIKPSSKFLKDYIIDNKIEVIISTGPPHSVHLIANRLKKSLNVKWIADYRDPWTFIDFFEDLKLTKSSLKKHHDLESEVMKNADKVVTVSKSWAKELKALYNRPIELIHNGFDPKDFKGLKSIPSDEFTITHIGSLNKDRNPTALWAALEEIKANNLELFNSMRIRIIGTISTEVVESVESHGLSNIVSIEKYIPHAEVLKALKSSDISLLLINDTSNKGGIIPGKLYEYLAIGNPIVAIGNKDGDSASIIKDCRAGKVFSYDESLDLKNYLLKILQNKSEFKKMVSFENVEQYSRRELALKYSALLDTVTEQI